VDGVGDSNGCADMGEGVGVWPPVGGRYMVVEDGLLEFGAAWGL
jgi:hypothetical protein